MSRIVRTLIIWLVAVALPVQGFAAAAMISCGPVHAQMGKAVDQAAHHHDANDDRHSHDHGTAEESKSDSQEPTPFLKFFKFKCSACASCCSGAAAPSPDAAFVGLSQSPTWAIPYFPSAEDTVVPDGLERPPRTFLG